MQALPIDALLPEAMAALDLCPRLVVEAEPGAGKTTRLPWALSQASGPGSVLVAEPRRLPARLAARFVAEERGARVGGLVGYSVRFEDVTSDETRLCFMTEGVLLRRLIDDPSLRGVQALVLDEFHERHIQSDLCLMLARKLQRDQRPDLKLVVMSATLQAERIARYLDDCPRLHAAGRPHPVRLVHLDKPDDRPLESQIVSAVKTALREVDGGHILVFVPGAAEIRRSSDALAPLCAAHGLVLLPLHGELSIAEQARAVEPTSQRKLIVSTNVAESSVTIDGVRVVIDSGLVRAAHFSPWSGLPRLVTEPVSRASAAQRAGRAGRTGPGLVLRLYTRGDLERRPLDTQPEIERSDLSEALLLLAGAGSADISSLAFLDPPPEAASKSARALLDGLGALDEHGKLTDIGRRMLSLPTHPRLARLIVEGARQGVARSGCLAAALLSERSLRTRSWAGGRSRVHDTPSGPSDVSELIDLFEEARAARFAPQRLSALGVDARAARAVERAEKQLIRLAAAPPDQERDPERFENALGRAVLAAFVDRLAKRVRPGEDRLLFENGASARLSNESVVRDRELMVALDVEERLLGRSSSASVRLASAVAPEWLLDEYSGRLTLTDTLCFDAETARVELSSQLAMGAIVLEQSRRRAPPSEETGALLAKAALSKGLGYFERVPELENVLERVKLLKRELPDVDLPELEGDALCAELVRSARGLTSLRELSEVNLAQAFLDRLAPEQRRVLFEQAPERVTLPSGLSVPIHYEPEKTPWIASRLQDFFGMELGPSVCRGRVPLTLHLLAPNRRALQVTTDLAGFWQRHYPGLRRQLMRRYPKHSWPEDGRTARPPARPERRGK